MERELTNEIALYMLMMICSFVTIYFTWRINGREGEFAEYLVNKGYRIGTLTFLIQLAVYLVLYRPVI